MRRGRTIVGSIVVVMGVLALTPTLAADGPTPSQHQFAHLSSGATELRWTTDLKGIDGLVLTVSAPDGTVTRHQFSADETPVFSLYDAAGSFLPDGSYTYELRAMPKVGSELRQQLQAAREDHGGATLSDPAGQLEAPVQSGSFLIQDGAVITPGLSETGPAGTLENTSAPSLDKVTAQGTLLTNADGIIRNSLCVGFDCPNSPTFSDTTILLMENNTRIKFDDTSTISGFPNRDWSINANDSASGGQNRFWVQDCGNSSQGGCSGNAVFSIEAGARSNALYVDNTGRLGLGTSNPVVDIHATRGDTPALRLEQNGSSGFAPQTWDVAGNETSFFIRDATNGSTLPFRIRPGAPSSSIDISASGNVGLGTGSPSERLHLKTTAASPMRVQIENSAQGWVFGIQADGKFLISRNGSGVQEMLINAANPNVTFAGSVTTGGPTCGSGCDRVFEPGFSLESIDDHAAEMWKNHYLPAVGPTAAGAPFNMTEKTGGMLNELEKAHIYIAQLNEDLKKKDHELTDLKERLQRLEKLLLPPSSAEK